MDNGIMKRLKKPRYAGGKPIYNIKTNDSTVHNFSFDEEGNIVLDDGSVGNLLLDNVTVRPGVDIRKAIERKYQRIAKQGEMYDVTDPLSGVNYGHGNGALESVYPEFDLITLGQLSKPLLQQAGNYLWYSQSPMAQYFRYPIGKMMYGLDAKFPTIYRKFVGGVMSPENGRIALSPRNSRFAFVDPKYQRYTGRVKNMPDGGWSGQESPKITNMSYGNSVRSHSSGDWDEGYTIAFDGNELLGKRVVSTEPSDLFTYGSEIAPKTSKVTLLSGDPVELEVAARKGIKTATSPELRAAYDDALQTAAKNRMNQTGKFNLEKDDYSDYAKQMRKLERQLFGDIRQKDVDFMNFVLRPDIEGKIYPRSVLNSIKDMPEEIGDLIGNAQHRAYLYDVDEFGNYIYNPASGVERNWRGTMGIDLKKVLPQWQRDLYYGTPYGYKYGKASGIHIKPENRGKFTALKKRTGKSASWFKAHGTPAQKKMATFALNARKWKHKYEYGKALGDPPSGRRPQTFLGSVAKNITGSDNAAQWTDGASGVLGFIPGVGAVITALDLGHDVNDLVHGDGATWSDVAWDVAGAIPFLKKGRKALKMLKKEKQLATSNRQLKKIDNQIKLWQDKKRTEDVINYGLWTPKLGDAVSDAK